MYSPCILQSTLYYKSLPYYFSFRLELGCYTDFLNYLCRQGVLAMNFISG